VPQAATDEDRAGADDGAHADTFSLVVALFHLVLIVVIAIYMLLDMERLENAIDRRFPPGDGLRLTRRIEKALAGYVRETLILSPVIGASAGVRMGLPGTLGPVPGEIVVPASQHFIVGQEIERMPLGPITSFPLLRGLGSEIPFFPRRQMEGRWFRNRAGAFHGVCRAGKGTRFSAVWGRTANHASASCLVARPR